MTQDKIPTQTDTYENDLNGVRQWIFSTAGSLLSAFLPQGILDFSNRTFGPDVAVPGRMRLYFVNGALQKTSDTDATPRSAVRPTPLSAVPVYGSTAAVAFESAHLSWGPLGRPYFYGSLPVLPSTSTAYSQIAGDGQYIKVTIPASTSGTPTWEWMTTMPPDATTFDANGIRMKTRLLSLGSGSITLTLSVLKQDGSLVGSVSRTLSASELSGSFNTLTSLSALSGGDVFKIRLAVSGTYGSSILELGRIEANWL